MKNLFTSLLVLCFAASAQAQVTVALQIERPQYLTHEPVTAVVTITNRSGKELLLQSSTKGSLAISWLDFKIRDGRGRVIARSSNAVFRAAKIAAGQSMARKINLEQMFPIQTSGSYSVVASVRQGTDLTDATIYTSGSARFSVSDGRVLFKQPFGAPGTSAPEREYQVIAYNDGQTTSVYASVLDTKRGTSFSTFRLSTALLFRTPQATLDSKNNLHVLYLANPAVYVHAKVDIDGKLIDTKYFLRGETSTPQLMAFSNGEIVTQGGIPYDPKAAQESRDSARDITDRP